MLCPLRPCLAGTFHSRRCGAGFQACCIADFQVGSTPDVSERRRFGNLRYGRLGSLRYEAWLGLRALNHEKSGLAPALAGLARFFVAAESARR
jgi:hypothetical protein